MNYYINEIEHKIFHGINLKYYYHKLEELIIFKKILESRKIMSRNDLLDAKYDFFNYLPKIYEQCENETCFAIHPKNKLFKDIYNYEDFSCAFNQYIRFNISFVFSENILGSEYNLQWGIPGEIRIPHSLSIEKNLVAIGCFDEIEYLLEKIKCVKNKKIIFSDELLNCNDIYKYTLEKKKRTYAVKKIVDECGYNIPIIEPFSGKIIDSNYEEDILKVKKLQNIFVNR